MISVNFSILRYLFVQLGSVSESLKRDLYRLEVVVSSYQLCKTDKKNRSSQLIYFVGKKICTNRYKATAYGPCGVLKVLRND